MCETCVMPDNAVGFYLMIDQNPCDHCGFNEFMENIKDNFVE